MQAISHHMSYETPFDAIAIPVVLSRHEFAASEGGDAGPSRPDWVGGSTHPDEGTAAMAPVQALAMEVPPEASATPPSQEPHTGDASGDTPVSSGASFVAPPDMAPEPEPLPDPLPHPRDVLLRGAQGDDPDSDGSSNEKFLVRLFSNTIPDAARGKTRAETYATLDACGPDMFLEEIARGAIPVEIAFRYELPLIHFMRWLETRSDPEDYNYAMGLCADSLAAKSRAVLEFSPDTAADGQMIREYAKRALELAERIRPDGWSGSKKPKGDSVSQAPLQIAIVLNPGQKPIPGTELLLAAAPSAQ